jgi:putative acetyltransferase
LDQWCFVSEEDGRMTGFMSMDTAGYLDMAFVIPEVMGNGTAAALYDTVMTQARGAGLTRFTVRAAHQSNRFLARRGWIVERFERYESKGQVYDLFHMALDVAS